MADIATLCIRVDTTELEKAIALLEKMKALSSEVRGLQREDQLRDEQEGQKLGKSLEQAVLRVIRENWPLLGSENPMEIPSQDRSPIDIAIESGICVDRLRATAFPDHRQCSNTPDSTHTECQE